MRCTQISTVEPLNCTAQWKAKRPSWRRSSAADRLMGVYLSIGAVHRNHSATNLHPLLPRATMSNVPSSSTTRSNLDAIFNTALRTYKNKTGKDITSHPLATELQSCDSPDTILAVLRRQMPNADQSQKADETFEKCLIPTINVLYTLSGTLGEVAGLVIITTSSPLRICAQTSFLKVFPPANIIFTGIGALLLVG